MKSYKHFGCKFVLHEGLQMEENYNMLSQYRV